MDAKQLKAKLQGNAIIRASLEQGDIRLIYKRTPTLSDDLLFGTWTVEVLLVDTQFPDLVINALTGMGFDVEKTGDKLLCEYTFPISPAERRAMEKKAQTKRDKARDQKHNDEISSLQQQLEELRSAVTAQIDDLSEEIQIQGLLPGRGKADPGPRGPEGPAGKPGRDLDATGVELQDLADVSKIPAGNGQVLVWSDLAQEWQPKHVASGITSISSGGGGGGGADWPPPENPGPGGPDGGINNGWLPKWWYETAEGHWMPRTGMQNIGSPETPVKEIFVSSGSIYFDEHVVDLQDAEGEKRLAYDGNVLAYEFYTEDGDAIQPIGDAPRDGYSYVRKDGDWVRLIDELLQLGFEPGEPLDGVDGGLWSELICGYQADGGDMNTGEADPPHVTVDGGDMNTGQADGEAAGTWDGGNLN